MSSAPTRRAAARAVAPQGTSDDAGFTLVEAVVAAAVIGVVLAGLGMFFLKAMTTSREQGQRQAAVRLAAEAMDAVRASETTTLLSGRAACDAACPAPVAEAQPLLAGVQRWDKTAAAGAPATWPVAPASTRATIDGVHYERHFYLGKCWMSTAGGPCAATAGLPVATLRAVVAVTWPSSACATGTCGFATATLITGIAGDPLFNSGDTTADPVLAQPADQVDVVGSPVSLALPVSGGEEPFTCEVAGLPDGLACDGVTISGTPTTTGRYDVTVSVSDLYGRSTAVRTFVWTINPALSVTGPGDRSDLLGAAVAVQPTAAGGVPGYRWSATGLPSGLSMDAGTGRITGTPDAVASAPVTITVTDARNRTATATFRWTIVSRPAVTGPGDQETTQGRAVTKSIGATGGVGPYRWSATNLPAGLSIDGDTGTISGAPTTPGASTVTVTVTDARGQSAATTFRWTVYTAPRLANPGDQDTYNGVSETLQPSVTDGVAPYTWTASGLPGGMRIDANTGLISGTPRAYGTSYVTVTVKDSRGETSSVTFNWSVNAAHRVNTYLSLRLSVSGSNLLYTWGAENLPPGLSINPTTGVVTGVPTTVGTWNIFILLTDASGQTFRVPFKWTIYAPMAAQTPAARTSRRGTAIPALSIAASGGVQPYSYSASGLPAGVTINPSTGVITGTPTTLGSYSSRVTVTDLVGNVVSTNYFTWQVTS